MTELEELLQQKRDIEHRIKELSYKGFIRCENAKIDRIHYSGSHADDWRVMVLTYNKDYVDMPEKIFWRSICTSTDRQDAIDHIQPIIDSLVELLEKLKKDGENQ